MNQAYEDVAGHIEIPLKQGGTPIHGGGWPDLHIEKSVSYFCVLVILLRGDPGSLRYAWKLWVDGGE